LTSDREQRSKGKTRTEGLQNEVLRRTFGPERQDVRGGWREMKYDEIHNLYSSPNIVRLIFKGRNNIEL
jgi:hypothetical protein